MSKQKLKGELSKEQITKLKEEHGVVYACTVPIDPELIDVSSNEAVIYIKPPSRNIMYAIGSHAQKGNMKKANSVIIKNCVIGGATELLEEYDHIYWAVIEQVGILIDDKTAKVKKF